MINAHLLNCKLKRLRLQHSWSQTEVANLVGVSRIAISNLETGKSVPSLEVAYNLSRIYGMDIEELFNFKYGVVGGKL